MFYTFSQNNSGGSFEFDEHDGITEWVIVEADSAKEAVDRASYIGLYFNGCQKGIDCPCCGDRWTNWLDDDDGTEVPSIYGTLIEEYHPMARWFKEHDDWTIAVHYKDGNVEWYGWDYDHKEN